MEHYERIDPDNKDVLSITRQGHFERYDLASRLIGPDSVVLDAACGYGYGTEMLKKKASQAIGIDRDEESISICKQRHGKEANIEFLVADVWNLPFPDSTFDHVVAMEMIEHIDDPERFVRQVYRVLKNDGSLLVSTPYGDNTKLPDGKPFSQYHVKEYTQNEMETILADCGFKVTENYGQYIILGAIMRLTNNRIKPVSNVKAGRPQAIMERLPFFADIFSRHYGILKSTAKNMFYHAVKR